MKQETRQKIEELEEAVIAALLRTAKEYQPTSVSFEERVSVLVTQLARGIVRELEHSYRQEQLIHAKESQQAIDDYVRMLLKQKGEYHE